MKCNCCDLLWFQSNFLIDFENKLMNVNALKQNVV